MFSKILWVRPWGPKDDTDPLFGETMKKAFKSKVVLKAYRTRVSLKGALLARCVPVLVQGVFDDP